jgi:hypothetical protein
MPRCVVQSMVIANVARTSNQMFCLGGFAVVHSRCRKFLKHVHNLFTCPLWLLSPAGLRLEISRESDKKKMNFIFNYYKKNFLTEKRSTRVDMKNRNSASKNFGPGKPGLFRTPRRRDFEADSLASRVDRIGLCAQFPASASRGKTLSKLQMQPTHTEPTGVF